MTEPAVHLTAIEDDSNEASEASPEAGTETSTESHVGLIAAPMSERERIQSQLEQLKQRESELRRELAIAEHPDLADAIRQIEGRAYGVRRVEAKIAQGLSKSEQRKKETLEKKLATALERRAEMDAQITALEAELLPLGQGRVTAFETERVEALLRLAALLEEHEAKVAAANLDLTSLVPSLAGWSDDLAALRSSR
jgi:hypothetical protein